MKKYVLSILSLILFISPVFSWDYNYPRAYISFESLNSDHNLTYGTYNSAGPNGYISFYSLNGNSGSNLGYFRSTLTSVGVSFENFSNFPFTISGNTFSIYNVDDKYGGIFGIGRDNGKLINDDFSFYFQAKNDTVYNSNGNLVMNFSSTFDSSDSYVSVNDGFVRSLYNSTSDLWFFNNDFPLTTTVTPPTDIQYFKRGQNYFFTTKGKSSVNDVYMSKMVSSVGNGFSFVSDLAFHDGSIYYDDLDFYSVLPGWDSSWDSSNSFFDIPDSYIVNGIYIFRINSFGRNTDRGSIGVLSKCNGTLCSGFNLSDTYSSLVFSQYDCDFSNTFSLGSNCSFIGGGFLYNILGNITGNDTVINVSSLPYLFQPFTYGGGWFHGSLGVSFNLQTSPYVLKYSYFNEVSNNYRYYTDTYNIILTGGYNSLNMPDILSNYHNIFNPPSSLTTGDVVSGSINKCLWDINYYNLNSLFCNSLGVYIGDNGVPILNTSLSGSSCIKIIQAFNDSGDLVDFAVSCDDAQNFLSGGFYQDSQGNIYYRCFGDTCLYSNTSQYFQSGIVTDSYYNSDSIFFSCPYPIITGFNNFLSNFSNLQLGQYSVGLPIMCFYSSFIAGKNYKLFSGFDSGLSQPLLGNIASSSDDRVYLFKFLDIILGLGILLFLLKLYHLTK